VTVGPEALEPEEVEGVRNLFPRFGRFTVALFNFAVEYVREHPALEPGFALSDEDLEQLFVSLPEWEAEVSRVDFDRARRFVRYQLEREIALQAWGDRGEFLQSLAYDSQLERAMELLEGIRTPDELLNSVRPAAAAVSR
jgi:hypothetical protein